MLFGTFTARVLLRNAPVRGTIKFAEALDVSVDYMLGGRRFGKYDNEGIKRVEGIQNMDANSRRKLFDTYIRDSKARAVYGS